MPTLKSEPYNYFMQSAGLNGYYKIALRMWVEFKEVKIPKHKAGSLKWEKEFEMEWEKMVKEEITL